MSDDGCLLVRTEAHVVNENDKKKELDPILHGQLFARRFYQW